MVDVAMKLLTRIHRRWVDQPACWIALLSLAISTLGAMDEPLTANEPKHNGKTVSQWVAALQPGDSVSAQPQQAEAEEALHTIGPDAIPFILRYHDTNKKQRLTLIRHACAVLTPEGDFKLMEALSDSDPRMRETALEVLPKSVLPAAVSDLTKLSADPVRTVRIASLHALLRLAPEREETITALLDFLRDDTAGPSSENNDFTREDAALELGHLGSKATAAVGELTRLLSDDEEGLREAAATALWKIARKTDGVPVLIERLETARDYQTALRALRVLGEIGAAAKSAVPAIRNKIEDPGVSFVPPNVDFTRLALAALQKIDPASAAELRKKAAESAREAE